VGNEPELMRSFIDIPQASGRKKQTACTRHFGRLPEGLSYSYDLDNGALVQVWKGGFLDATPMWHDRGDGHADPLGQRFTAGRYPAIGPFTGAWPDSLGPDAANSAYMDISWMPAGIQRSNIPCMEWTGDRPLSPQENGKWLSREIQFQERPPLIGPAIPASCRQKHRPGGDDTWAVDDKRYYVQLFAIKPEIGPLPGQEMILLATESIQYYFIW
jgi:hypothetical protein